MKARWFYPACVGALMLVLTAIGVMSFFGYRLIEAAAIYMLFGILIVMLLGGLAIFLTRKVHRKNLRLITGTSLGLALATLAMLLLSFFVFVNNFYTPQQFAMLESESGRKVVVLRQISQKYAYERAAVNANSALQYEDLGYQYQIYPVFSKFFYNSKIAGEGELEIGCTSEAVLMHQWQGDSLRMYIQNPESYDSGELFLR